MRACSGFSLIEILVALMLGVLITTSVLSIFKSDRDYIDEVLEDLERTIRFTTNEATLQGTIVRMVIQMDEEPVQFYVEKGPNDGLILPDFRKYTEEDDLSISEKLEYQKKLQELSGKFSKIQEFSDSGTSLTVPEEIRILGFASSGNGLKFQYEGDAFIYFYTSGEKDNAIIFLGNEQHVVTLETNPFTDDINRNFYPLDGVNEDNLDIKHEQKVKEIYDEWVKR